MKPKRIAQSALLVWTISIILTGCSSYDVKGKVSRKDLPAEFSCRNISQALEKGGRSHQLRLWQAAQDESAGNPKQFALSLKQAYNYQQGKRHRLKLIDLSGGSKGILLKTDARDITSCKIINNKDYYYQKYLTQVVGNYIRKFSQDNSISSAIFAAKEFTKKNIPYKFFKPTLDKLSQNEQYKHALVLLHPYTQKSQSAREDYYDIGVKAYGKNYKRFTDYREITPETLQNKHSPLRIKHVKKGKKKNKLSLYDLYKGRKSKNPLLKKFSLVGIDLLKKNKKRLHKLEKGIACSQINKSVRIPVQVVAVDRRYYRGEIKKYGKFVYRYYLRWKKHTKTFWHKGHKCNFTIEANNRYKFPSKMSFSLREGKWASGKFDIKNGHVSDSPGHLRWKKY